jgi:hypothetical protein
MINGGTMGNVMKGSSDVSGHGGQVKVLSRNLLAVTEGNHRVAYVLAGI